MSYESDAYESFVKTMVLRESLRSAMRAAKRQKDWAALREHAAELLQSDPNELEAQVAIGMSYEKEGLTDQAVQSYEQTTPLLGHGSAAVASTLFRRLDILYTRAGRYHDSVRVCRLYAERFPDSWDAWNRLRRAARNAGDGELSLTAGIEADAIRSEREYVKERNRARGARLLELYEARLAELGYGPAESGEENAQSPAPGAAQQQPLVWLHRSTAAPHDYAWLAREQALKEAIEQLLREEADEDLL
ncbi:MAG: hypothetical protein R6X16_07450 [Anaerolineae bacterium]